MLLRRDRPFDNAAPSTSAADVLRYVAVARHTLRGPLVLEIEGPGDPLASPETVLRSLALIHEHHPDVLTGLVIDGPLLGEYCEELESFGLNYLALRLDAATARTAARLVDGAVYRADLLDRKDAALLYVEEARRALSLARQAGIPIAVRTTLIPTINRDEIEAIATIGAKGGAQRMDVVPHVPVKGGPLARAGVPDTGELARAQAAADAIFDAEGAPHHDPLRPELEWLSPDRFQPVDLDQLDAVDVLGVLVDAVEADERQAPVLPRRSAQLIAVASTDGTLVDLSLRGTNRLLIYSVTEERIRCLGARTLSTDLRRRQDGVGDARLFLRSLIGCSALVATHLSKRAVTLLQAVGIRAAPVGGPVSDVLDRVARGTIRHAN